MRRPMTPAARILLLASVAVLSLFACNKEKSAAAGRAAGGGAPGGGAPAAPDMPPDTVIATIKGDKITAGDLDKSIDAQLQQIDEEAGKRKFQLRRQKLDELLMQRMVQAEAKKKGMSEDAFMKAEVEDK